MIIRLQTSQSAPTPAPTPAWPAVEKIQRSSFDVYCLVTQPDHARISGAIAANFSRAIEPDLTPDIVEAIALHDHGWSRFEGYSPSCRPPLTDSTGRPLSFLDAPPEVFLQAWSGSIEAAAGTSPAGQHIVSSHFRVLGERRLRSQIDPPRILQRLSDFITLESERERDLVSSTHLLHAQLDRFLKLLQFCDVLSLVICSAASGTLDFPDNFSSGPLRLTFADKTFYLTPSPLSAPASFRIPCFAFRDGQLQPLPELNFSIA